MGEKVTSFDGYVVSDLHIFGCSSLYLRYLPLLYRQVTSHAVTVLNGDTFDFKRSIYASTAETTSHAVAWVRDLAHRAPNSKIFFLLGNHDSQELFVRALNEALPELPNVSVVPDCLRLDSTVFLHGDVVDLPPGENNLSHVRERYSHAEPSWLSRLFAQVITYTGANKIEYLRHSKKVLADRILTYLTASQPEVVGDIKDIYFGHTHVPLDHFVHKGITFRNTGSMIRGLPWRPMEFAFRGQNCS
jgi:UDP-2,3-diacylglucosamine pyrophosphatase LpxH